MSQYGCQRRVGGESLRRVKKLLKKFLNNLQKLLTVLLFCSSPIYGDSRCLQHFPHITTEKKGLKSVTLLSPRSNLPSVSITDSMLAYKRLEIVKKRFFLRFIFGRIGMFNQLNIIFHGKNRGSRCPCYGHTANFCKS